MIIRPALVQDSRGIALVHVSSWQHAYRGIVPQAYLDQLSVANRESRWVEFFERGSSETLVADVAGHIVGFISYGNLREEHTLQDVGEIYAIYVASSHWSSGIGRSLWEAALARLRERSFAQAIVWVLAANEQAIRFYERVGFALSRGSETPVELGGMSLPKVRYEIAIA